jgi:GH24 family phage-related lysozyme (muramidase)
LKILLLISGLLLVVYIASMSQGLLETSLSFIREQEGGKINVSTGKVLYDEERDIYLPYPEFGSDKLAIGPGLNTFKGQSIKNREYSGEEVRAEFKNIVSSVITNLESQIPNWKDLNVNQQSSIVSLTYNVGLDALKYKTEDGERVETDAFKALSKGDYKTFKDEAFDSEKGFVRSKGNIVSGLQTRREDEETLFEKEVTSSEKGSDSIDVGIEDTLVDDWTSNLPVIE